MSKMKAPKGSIIYVQFFFYKNAILRNNTRSVCLKKLILYMLPIILQTAGISMNYIN